MNSLRIGTLGAAIAVLVTLAWLGPAMAQDADLKTLLERMERLERDIRLLNLQGARGSTGASADAAVSGAGDVAPSGPAMARVAVRLTTLEEEVRTLTGNSESLSHEIARLNERLSKLVGDVDYRLSALEAAIGTGGVPTAAAKSPSASATPVMPGGAGAPAVQSQSVPGSASGVLGQISAKDLAAARPAAAATAQSTAQPAAAQPTAQPSAVQPQPVAAPNMAASQAQAAPQAAEVDTDAPVSSAPILPPGSAQDRYAFAFGLLRKAEYDRAEQALTEFMTAHADSPLAHNAHYWLGETFYVRTQYARAAEVFLDAFQKTPTGAKAPDTLLKLGMSLSQLDKKREACASYTKLLRDYPRAAAGIKRTVQRESKRIQCE